MVGGVTPTYRDSDSVNDSASASTDASAPAADSGRLSVVIQPGIGQLSATVANESTSPSVASRVLAFAPLIDEAARAADLDSALLMAVIDVESGGDPQAVSPKGAAGLMQMMPDTGAQHGATNLFDPRQNLAAGARYLRRLIRQFGDLSLALAAYNAGEGAVQKYGGQIPPYAETMRYVPKVMDRYHRYRDATQDTAQDAAQDRAPTAVPTAVQNARAPARSGLAAPAPDVAHGRFLLVRGNRRMDQATGE
jgi:hypothetical protein